MIPTICLHILLAAHALAPPAQVDAHAALAGMYLPEKPLPHYDVMVAPLPRSLHFASLAAAALDVANTAATKNHWGKDFKEADPFVRPIVDLPNREYELTAAAGIIGLNLLADEMNRSPRWHRFARPLLKTQTALNVAGITFTLANRHSRWFGHNFTHPPPTP